MKDQFLEFLKDEIKYQKEIVCVLEREHRQEKESAASPVLSICFLKLNAETNHLTCLERVLESYKKNQPE